MNTPKSLNEMVGVITSLAESGDSRAMNLLAYVLQR